MTDFYICYADAQVSASVVSATSGYSGKSTDDFSIGNALSGARSRHYRTSNSQTAHQIDFDMGSGVTINPDYCILARADILNNSDSGGTHGFTLRGDDNPAYSSVEEQTKTYSDNDLIGPNQEDAILELSAYSTDYRYWQVDIFSTASIQHHFSKLYFGNWLDLGRNPSYKPIIKFGEFHHVKRRRARTITLLWRGISDTNRMLFDSKVAKNADIHPLFLYDKNDNVLNGLKLIHCELLVHTWDYRDNNSDLNATFRELI